MTAVGVTHLVVATGCGLGTGWVVWQCHTFLRGGRPDPGDPFVLLWSLLALVVVAVALVIGLVGSCLTVVGLLAGWSVLCRRRWGRWSTFLAGLLWLIASISGARALGLETRTPEDRVALGVLGLGTAYGIAACIVPFLPRFASGLRTARRDRHDKS